MSALTADNLKRILQKHANARMIVAFSGGVDSHVLLHLLSKTNLLLHAVHVNHQWHDQSNAWELYCQKTCATLNVPFSSVKITVLAQGNESLETASRRLRYAALSKYLDKNSVLLTAHHANDQAETFLMNALRGAGIHGLRAMPFEKPFAQSFLLRPLLSFSKNEIVNYAKQHRLQWIDDHTNANTQFTRNFLRNDIMPLLQSRFPALISTLNRSARLCNEAVSLLDEKQTSDVSYTNQLDLNTLHAHDFAKQKWLLRAWLLKNNVLMPSEKQLHAIFNNVIHARIDANPLFNLDKKELRRYRHRLFLLEKKPEIPMQTQHLRTRQPGDRVKLPGWAHSKSLKNYFQEMGVPVWQRDFILLRFDESGFCVELVMNY